MALVENDVIQTNVVDNWSLAMQTIQIDDSSHVIGNTGYGGADMWKMLRTNPVAPAVSYGNRNYSITGWAYSSTTYTDCFDYNPWDGHLYVVHGGAPTILRKYRINRSSDTAWTVTSITTYNLPSDAKFRSWTGVKFAFNHQSNDGYLYLIANANLADSASIHRVPLGASGTPVPELVCNIPQYYPSNLVSFAVTDRLVFLPYTNTQIGGFLKKTGERVYGFSIPSVNSYFCASSFRHSGNLYVMAGGYNTQRRQFEVNDVVRIKDITLASTVRRENPLLSAHIINERNEEDMVGYRVLVNSAQLFPASGYTTYSPTPVNISIEIPNWLLQVGSNTISLDGVTASGRTVSQAVAVTKLNDAPEATIVLAKNPVHADHPSFLISVSDTDSDEVQFQLYLNGKQMYPPVDWTSLNMTPFDFSHYFTNDQLIEGDNTILLKLKDSLGATKDVSTIVKKVNMAPVIVAPSITGLTVKASFRDEEMDQVRYKVTVGNTVIYPESGTWSELLQTPFSISHDIPLSKFIAGNSYTVRIEAEDHLGKVASAWATQTILDYAGLMFTDELGSYYSTSVGEILKVLQMGLIVAGEKTGVFKVYVKNTSSVSYEGVTLAAEQKDLDAVNEVVELSLSDSPFEPSNSVMFPGVMSFGTITHFFVRISTTREALGGGKFNIWVTGDPV